MMMRSSMLKSASLRIFCTRRTISRARPSLASSSLIRVSMATVTTLSAAMDSPSAGWVRTMISSGASSNICSPIASETGSPALMRARISAGSLSASALRSAGNCLPSFGPSILLLGSRRYCTSRSASATNSKAFTFSSSSAMSTYSDDNSALPSPKWAIALANG